MFFCDTSGTLWWYWRRVTPPNHGDPCATLFFSGGPWMDCIRSQHSARRGQKWMWLASEEEMLVTSRAFSAYGRPLGMVLSLKYLGRVLSALDDYWTSVVQNLSNARMVWRIMSRILSREGVRSRVSGFFFKAIVQSVLLFGTEMWVVNPHMGQVQGGFQYQVERRLTGRIPRQRLDGNWEYTLVEAARAEEGFELMETYIRWRQNVVTQYIATWSLLDLWEAT